MNRLGVVCRADAGVWAFGPGEKIRLEVIFQPGYGDHLYETPLSKDQEIEQSSDGQLRVTATVAKTPQLQWWLLGFGEGVEVVNPEEIRTSIAETARAIAVVYQKGRKR